MYEGKMGIDTAKKWHPGVVFEHCPNGSVRHDDSCYMFSHELANWAEAMVYCTAYGGQLAFIQSPEEQVFIQNEMKLFLGSQTDSAHYYWLGGTDAVSEGEWYWANIVEKIMYTNWKQGEPNDNHAHTNHHQDCLAIYSETGLWDDGWCETQHNFICEIQLDVETSQIIGK
ncbi:galactose-specific lectin nattectin-like [Mya arenaria]|uniref:galactose-specific lectin nattectin-like n=1 Tax=Mya arenaria TaxID=6604 RepID=UPI0022E6BE7F|nr:galactose-specific lectin nattectin-like [Mya arenaria]